METLRTSSYMIPVKLEQEEGKYMLIHGYTGAMDIVSGGLLKKIKSVAKGHDFSETMLQTLLKRGYITTKTQEEEYAYVARLAKALHKKHEILDATFTWVVTYNCNFRCPYCYEKRDMKNSHCWYTFTKEQVDLAYSAQDLIQPNPRLRKKTITLYGGEPLLEENKEIVNYIVEEGCKRGFLFCAITNGYELNHFENLLSPDKIYKLQVTVDGVKDFHNQRRPHFSDNNTFDRIIDNIKMALEKGVEVAVRMNSDGQNLNQYIELEQYFKEKGFYDYVKFKFYLGFLKDNQYITDEEYKNIDFLSINEFVEKQKELGIDPYRTDTTLYRRISVAMSDKRPLLFMPITCVAQANGHILDPFGNIYPCWEVIDDKTNIKGHYSKNGIVWNDVVKKKWEATDIVDYTPCDHCKYALICGGGCPFYKATKRDYDCKLFKKTFHLMINKAYKENAK